MSVTRLPRGHAPSPFVKTSAACVAERSQLAVVPRAARPFAVIWEIAGFYHAAGGARRVSGPGAGGRRSGGREAGREGRGWGCGVSDRRTMMMTTMITKMTTTMTLVVENVIDLIL